MKPHKEKVFGYWVHWKWRIQRNIFLNHTSLLPSLFVCLWVCDLRANIGVSLSCSSVEYINNSFPFLHKIIYVKLTHTAYLHEISSYGLWNTSITLFLFRQNYVCEIISYGQLNTSITLFILDKIVYFWWLELGEIHFYMVYIIPQLSFPVLTKKNQICSLNSFD